MPRNIEVKVRLAEPRDLPQRLLHLGARFAATLRQRDVFFAVPEGRLKLRFNNDDAELIHYHRANAANLRGSDYERLPIGDGVAIQRVLGQALSIVGEVHKVRQLYRLENIRIHIDEVEGLGAFMEIEAVVDASHDEEQCHDAALGLLRDLGIGSETYESKAYVDLLNDRQHESSHDVSHDVSHEGASHVRTPAAGL